MAKPGFGPKLLDAKTLANGCREASGFENSCLTLTVTCQGHLIGTTFATSSSPCPRLPYASHPGGRCSHEHPGHALSTQRDVLRGPGAWLSKWAPPHHTSALSSVKKGVPQDLRQGPAAWQPFVRGGRRQVCCSRCRRCLLAAISEQPSYLHLERLSPFGAHPGAALLGQTKPELWPSPALTPLPGIRKHFLPVLPPECRQQGCPGGTRGFCLKDDS